MVSSSEAQSASVPESLRQTIFVTGANGFIGRRLVARLAADGRFRVRALVRRLPANCLPTVDWIVGDLLDPNSYRTHLAGVDLLLHLGAAVGRCSRDEFFRVNAWGTEQLVAFASGAQVKRLLLISTIAVRFESISDYPYAQSKVVAERIVSGANVPHQILRPTIVVGADGPNWQALRKLATLPVTPVFGGGWKHVQPIDVDDLVEAIVRLVSAPIDETVIELGGPDIVTMREFLRRIRGTQTPSRFRPFYVPFVPLRGLLSGLERLIGHRLPLTAGQLAVFANDSTVSETRFHQRQQSEMRSLDEVIARASAARAQRPPRSSDDVAHTEECRVFSQYLLRRPPTKEIAAGYVRAHRMGVVRDELASRWEVRLLKVACRHPGLCQLVDAYARFFAPASLVRQKLVLLLALWECEPQSDECLQLTRPVGTIRVGLRIGLRLLGCGLLVLAGWILLTPLKLLTGRDTATELPGESSQ